MDNKSKIKIATTLVQVAIASLITSLTGGTLAIVFGAATQTFFSRLTDYIATKHLINNKDNFINQVATNLIELECVKNLTPNEFSQEFAQAREAMVHFGISAREYVELGLDAEAAAESVSKKSKYHRISDPAAPARRILVQLYKNLKFEEMAIRELDCYFQETVLHHIENEPSIKKILGWTALLTFPRKKQPKTINGAAIYLDPTFELVKYRKRPDNTDRRFHDWAKSNDHLAIRIYEAKGGAGKTRFILEQLKIFSAEGWRAGFLNNDRRLAQLYDAAYENLFEIEVPTMIAIDYAEDRETQLNYLLSALYKSDHHYAVRIILLTRRTDGQWWKQFRDRADGSTQDLLRDHKPTEESLSILLDDLTTRIDLYDDTISALRSTSLQRSGTDLSPPPLNDEHFSLPLFVQMAALDRYLGGTGIDDESGLLSRVLDHESRFWRRGNLDLREGVSLIMGLITLWQGIDANRVAGLPTRFPITSHAHALQLNLPEVYNILKDLYGNGPKIDPLRPDRLGEKLVLQCSEKITTRELMDATLGEGVSSQDKIQTIATLLRMCARENKCSNLLVAAVHHRAVKYESDNILQKAMWVANQHQPLDLCSINQNLTNYQQSLDQSDEYFEPTNFIIDLTSKNL